ncbi:MAG: hypothetical protein K2L38_09085 [Dysosmobacter sp.]|nr:hypothetical protein [Dysosmobacter sp.]
MKRARYLLRDPRYPNNCILDVLRVEQEYPYVLIPTNARTIGCLWEEYDRRVVLCYPTEDQKETYRTRFRVKGTVRTLRAFSSAIGSTSRAPSERAKYREFPCR